MIGAGEYLEIWNAEAWAKQEEELDAAAPEIAEGLAGKRSGCVRCEPSAELQPSDRHTRSPERAGEPFCLMPTEHAPVLAPELTALLAPRPGQTAVDCTFGGGGHARRIAAELGPEGTLICIDRDPAAEARFERFAAEAPCRTRFLGSDFAAGLRTLRGEGIHPDMVYMDLGMSSMQVDARERGFSYSYDAPLDMRMDTRQQLTAADLLNEWPESRIAQALRRFGEERYAGGIAREIVRRRPLATTSELVDAVKAGMPASARFGGGHPAKRTFQAIRIAVNGELDSLDDALPTAWGMLPIGGRLAAISFHSLEDRRVKRFLAERARGCVCPPELPVCVCGREPEAELLARRAIAPGPGEVAANPRSKLRPPARRGEDRRRPGRRERRLMAAAATARAAAPARAPRRKPPARPRKAPPARRPGGQLIPIAVGTATAVRNLPDSGLIVRLTRGRAWIGVLGVLLVGIVTLNVITLSFAAGAGHDRPEHPGARAGELDAAQPRRPALRRRARPPRRRLARPGRRAERTKSATSGPSPSDVATAAQRLAAAEAGY